MADEASRALPPVPLEPLAEDDPSQLGNYRLLGRLGAGGMGVAYLASDSARNWIVVKTIWPHLAADRVFRARLVRELQVMRTVSGGSTAALLDADTESKTPWFAMEFIPGITLARRVEDSGALPRDEVKGFARDLLGVVQSVHAAGVTHRDLKPANIMLSPDGPRLIDFGVADLEGGTQLTRAGAVLGSTGWLAPEQVRGDDATAATDVHAWALCVLYAATGQSPFGAESSATAIYRVLESTPDVPGSIVEPLRTVLIAALNKDPLSRPTIDQAMNQLSEEQKPAPAVAAPPAPPRAAVPAAAAPASAPVPTHTEAPVPAPGSGRRWFGPLNLATGPAVLLMAGVGMVVITLLITLLNASGGDEEAIASPDVSVTAEVESDSQLSNDGVVDEVGDGELAELDDSIAGVGEPGCARYQPYLGSEGETVTVLTWYFSSVSEDRGYEAAWREFERCTGITIELENEEWSTAYLTKLITRAQDGTPPDIAMNLTRQDLQQLAPAGLLVPNPTSANENLDRYWKPFWRTYSSVDGTPYATPLSTGLWFQIVYSPEKFSEWGYAVPTSWQETLALSDTMVADGRKPWCGGLRAYAGDAVTWLSFLVLSMHGPEVYESWLSGALPFESPEIRASMAELESWMKNPAYVNGGFGGVKSLVNTWSSDVLAKVADGNCGMTASWDTGSRGELSSFLVSGPKTAGQFPAMASASLASGFTDREAVQKVRSYLASPDFATAMMDQSEWWTSVNTGVPASRYKTERQAALLQTLNADTSLLATHAQSAFPRAVDDALREGMEGWFAGSKSTRQVLRESDQAWAQVS